MKPFWGLTLIILLASGFTSCEKDYLQSENENTSSDDNSDEGDGTVSELETDYIWDTSTEIPIVLNSNSITAESDKVAINGSIVTIKNSGNYAISGTLTNGQIIVEDTTKDDIIRLILKGTDITCLNNAPIFIAKAKKVIIVLDDNTTNKLTDGTSYTYATADTDEPSSTIFSKSDLTFYGSGQLIIDANYKDAIASKDGLIIKSGSFEIKSIDDGIIGKDYVLIHEGTLSVNAAGDAIKSTNTGISTAGYVTINNGVINLISGADGIQAETAINIVNGTLTITSGGGSNQTVSSTATAKGIKATTELNISAGTISISAADDALHSENTLSILGGTMELSTADDGIHAEESITISDANITVSKSYEGIECGTITINSGNISVTSSNDCFNASMGLVAGGTESNDGSNLNVYGGTISVNMTGKGDGFDSNGNITMTEGTLIIQGPSSQPEVAFDYNGTFKITGGFIIASGPNSGNMAQAPSSNSTQYVAMINNSSIGTNLFHIQDANGNELVTFKPIRSSYYIVFSSPALQSGATYTVYSGGTYSGGTIINGYSTGGEYSGGSQLTSFTISSIITKVGSTSGGGGGGW